MKILAFDLGTAFGWALLDAERNEAATGTIDLARYGTRPAKLNAFLYWLDDVDASDASNNVWPDVIAYERPHLRGYYATAMLVGQMGILEAWAVDLDARIETATTAEVKKFATGKGRAEKDEVLAQMRMRFGKRFGWTTRPRKPPTEHEADAAAVALIVEARLTNEEKA